MGLALLGAKRMHLCRGAGREKLSLDNCLALGGGATRPLKISLGIRQKEDAMECVVSGWEP